MLLCLLGLSASVSFSSFCESAKSVHNGAGCCANAAADISCETGPTRKNFLFILLDDISVDRFPESGNPYLQGKLPNLEALRGDPDAVTYPHHFAPSSVCAPAQYALFSGSTPARHGAQFQFALDSTPGKPDYAVVPPDDVIFTPETLGMHDYVRIGAGKLDYQVGSVISTFFNEILGGGWIDISAAEFLNAYWDKAKEIGKPFYVMTNAMDTHSSVAGFQTSPIKNANGEKDGLPFGEWGFTQELTLKVSSKNNSAAPWSYILPDLLSHNVTGYAGTCDPRDLSHATATLPGYMSDDIGARSILCQEYDLLRNVDYKIGVIVDKLKADGLYDDTHVIVFGDHGSGPNPVGKGQLAPSSLATPLYIKYAKGMAPTATTQTAHGKVDERIVRITDLYATTLSLESIPIPSYFEGIPLAGAAASEERHPYAYAHLARQGGLYMKSYSVTDGEFFYVRNLMQDPVPRLRGDNPYQAGFLIGDAMIDYHRKLACEGRLDDKFMYSIHDSRRPDEEFFHISKDADPSAVDNLLYSTAYSVTCPSTDLSESKIDATYTRRTLTGDRHAAYMRLRDSLEAWVDGLEWGFKFEVDIGDPRFGHEKIVAESFWPNQVQPVTHDPVIVVENQRISLDAPTNGSVVMYKIVPDTQYAPSTSVTRDNFKELYPEADYVATGLVASLGTLKGHVIEGSNLEMKWAIGSTSNEYIFISSDETQVMLYSDAVGEGFFDTRDATWNGETHVGLTDDGEWIGTPLTIWDITESVAFAFGPDRGNIWSTPNGGVVARRSYGLGGIPAPFYYSFPGHDVTSYPMGYDASGQSIYTFSRTQRQIIIGDVLSFSIDIQPGFTPTVAFPVFPIDFVLSPVQEDDGVLFMNYDGEPIPMYENSTVYARAVRKGYVESALVEVRVGVQDSALLEVLANVQCTPGRISNVTCAQVETAWEESCCAY